MLFLKTKYILSHLNMRIIPVALFLICSLGHLASAQQQLYPNSFDLRDVQLLAGPFKHAQDLNGETLLKYKVDRLLAPYRKEAGLIPRDSSYSNWAGLDGHVGGHYLSAVSMHYASTGDLRFKQLLDYMIAELNDCMLANTRNHADWGAGYIGGVPNSAALWKRIQKGDVQAIWDGWVPWYNLHKTYAGLRDAWLYGGNTAAKQLFLSFCDWGIQITSRLSAADMEKMLANEHGGMNEMFADAYQMSGQQRYLIAAKRFSHQFLLNPMSHGKDILDNLHANTQVPKAIGFQRIGELTGDSIYLKAGSFFWQQVALKRSLATGGNSRREFFPGASATIDYLTMAEGPESCNTNNMLKLSDDLFRMSPNVVYADYFERALFNHILSTQHPVHGGYVYFTPARPRHYRVYSAPNEAMWCCVGTGMENHSKYAEFIYKHTGDSLYLNLFIASRLNWKAKGIRLIQSTGFPFTEQTKIKIDSGAGNFKLMVRYPKWVAPGKLKLLLNGLEIAAQADPTGYIAVSRNWKTGDELVVELPMHNTVEPLSGYPNYLAFMHGPILLGSKTGTEDLAGLIADDGRWSHIAHGKMLPADQAPVIVDDALPVLTQHVKPLGSKPLHFTLSGISVKNQKEALELEPFFGIHDSRYMMYFMALNPAHFKQMGDSLARLEKKKIALENRTIDAVAPGQQQPEVDHQLKSGNAVTGNSEDEFYRAANDGGFFSYVLSTGGKTELSLQLRYRGGEKGKRQFKIFLDDKLFIAADLTEKLRNSGWQDLDYVIPKSFLQGRKKITVRFQSESSTTTGALYYIRLLQPNQSISFKSK